MYHRIFIFALCVLWCFVGCKTSETKGADFSAANRDENIFIDGDDGDIMQQTEGSALVREFSDDDSESSGVGPDDEDAFEGSGDEVEGSGGRGRAGVKPPQSPVLATPPPPPTEHSKTPRPSPPDEASTTAEPEPVKTTAQPVPTHPKTPGNEVPEVTSKTTSTERPPPNTEDNNVPPGGASRTSERPTSFFSQPGILAAVVGGAVVGLLCAILLVMFIVYRMRKKDEGSYALDEPKRSPRNTSSYQPPNKEFYA